MMFEVTDSVDGIPIEYRANGMTDTIFSVGNGQWVICNARGQYRRGPGGMCRKFRSANAAMRALCSEASERCLKKSVC